MKVYRDSLLNMKQSWWSLLLGRGTTQSLFVSVYIFTTCVCVSVLVFHIVRSQNAATVVVFLWISQTIATFDVSKSKIDHFWSLLHFFSWTVFFVWMCLFDRGFIKYNMLHLVQQRIVNNLHNDTATTIGFQMRKSKIRIEMLEIYWNITSMKTWKQWKQMKLPKLVLQQHATIFP